MTISNKYLLLSISKASIATLCSLVIVFGFFKFLEELNEVGQFNYTVGMAIQHILLLLPSFFNSLVLISILIGAVFSLGSLNSNKELQIFQCGGISRKELIKKIIAFSFYLSFFTIIVLEIFTPYSIEMANKVKSLGLGKNTFSIVDTSWIKRDQEILFLKRSKNSKEISEVKIYKLDNDGNLQEFSKSNNIQFNNAELNLHDIATSFFNTNGKYTKISKKNNSTKLYKNINIEDLDALKNDVRIMSLYELYQAIFFSIRNQTNNTQFVVEFLTRIVRPLTLIGMILIALPFVLDIERSISIGKRIALASGIGVITHLMTKATSIMSLKFTSINLIGPIIPTIFLILLGVIIFKYRSSKI